MRIASTATHLIQPRVRTRAAARTRTWTWIALVAITVAAGALRLVHLGQVPGNPFYDAAVRTMSGGGHALLFGALEPGGSVSVDKPPVDLWFQVASVKLFGFNPTALKLPQALAGTLAVPLLYDLVRRPFGRAAGLAAALALAVFPVAVVTARSDTMDTLMVAFVLSAAWLIVRAIERDRLLPLLGAGAVMGVAFNVKLFQALVAAPALAVLFLAGASWPSRRRVLAGLATVAVFAVVAFAWIAPAALTPARDRPYPIGSSSGSVWQLVFGFNGVDRLSLTDHSRHAGQGDANPGPLRLLGAHYGARVGSELLPALLFGVLFAAAAFVRRRQTRLQRAFTLSLLVWLGAGLVVFSRMHALRARYLETITPAAAAALGIGVIGLATARGRLERLVVFVPALAVTVLYALHLKAVSGQVVALAAVAAGAAALAALATGSTASRAAACLALIACLAAPAAVSVQLVQRRESAAQRSGAMPAHQTALLTRYLRAHRGHTRYELASIAPAKVAPLIVVDPQPVLMLTSYRNRPLISVAALRAKVRAGDVRYFLIGRRCRGAVALSTTCVPAARWAVAHSVDVTRATGVHRGGLLYRIERCVSGPATSSGRGRTATPRATRSPRSPSRTSPATCGRRRRA